MNAFASSPSFVLALTAPRNTSPVASGGTPSFAASNDACVPFPAPGFPKRTMIMLAEMYGGSGAVGNERMGVVRPTQATVSVS